MTRYPNLLELHNHYPCGEPAMCDHAGIEPELLQAVLYGGELLEPAEIMGLARLYGCPAGVLLNRETIMLDMGRLKHAKMAAVVDAAYMLLKRTDSQEAERYLKFATAKYQRFRMAVNSNGLSYGHYLGVRECVLQYVQWSTPMPKRRALQR